MNRHDDVESEREYFAAALQAMHTGGAAGLDALGWWELLPHLDDRDLRIATFAVFRAQGRTLSSSAALGGLLAQPYLEGTAVAPGSVLATVQHQSDGDDMRYVVIGEPEDRQLLVDRPGAGAAIINLDRVELHPIDLPGRLIAHEVHGDLARVAAAIDEPEASTARAQSRRLGRVALGLEIFGAAEGAVALATEYASAREQFGQPIGRFQAVRHLLAWAHTDCTAIYNVARQAVLLDEAPAHFDEIVKAIAGRNGRLACERSLQVLGGIGFTAEHDHHHFHSRVLALDALLGTSSELTHRTGARLRADRADPGIASAILAGSF